MSIAFDMYYIRLIAAWNVSSPSSYIGFFLWLCDLCSSCFLFCFVCLPILCYCVLEHNTWTRRQYTNEQCFLIENRISIEAGKNKNKKFSSTVACIKVYWIAYLWKISCSVRLLWQRLWFVESTNKYNKLL